MIILSPTDAWPTKQADFTLDLGVDGPKSAGPAAIPVPFPAVLNFGIEQWVQKTGARPTHLLCGPDAKRRFMEFGHFQASMRKEAFEEAEVHSVNGLQLVWTVEEGMVILGDCE
jgi:hypothetical protein